MNATPQQQKIFDALRENEALARQGKKRKSLVVNAKAGTGKSTTCAESIKRLPNASIAYITFGKDVNEDFKAKLEGVRNCLVGTSHSFGNGALRNNTKSKLDKEKVRKIVEELLPKDKNAFKHLPTIISLVNYAKDRGIGLLEEDEYASWSSLIERFGLEVNGTEEWIINMARAVLERSNEAIGTHDFADMIYLPLLRNYQFERFDYVFIDEAQDTNATRREMFKRMLKPNGCVVVVGDYHQAIYGFSGADNDSMQLLTRDFACEEFDLNVCFRCDREIIREAQKIVPDIYPRSDAGPGTIRKVEYLETLKTRFEVKGAGMCGEFISFNSNDAILCRYNAPLVRLAFALIRRGIPCRIEGRDVGFGLIRLVEKLGGATLDEFTFAVEEYEIRELDKARNKPGRTELINDKCSMLRVLIERARDQHWGVSGLKDSIRSMFSDANDPKAPKDVLTLSSVHKSKGREWPRVFILGRAQFMPSKYAEQEWQVKQEMNLIYVAITRAKHELVYVTNVPEK